MKKISKRERERRQAQREADWQKNNPKLVAKMETLRKMMYLEDQKRSGSL